VNVPSFTRSSESHLRTHSRARLAAVLALGALLAAACGSSSPSTPAILDVAGIQTAIEQSIVKERGIATVVICPADVPRESGFHFTCTARLDVGSYSVSVIENADGGVRYSSATPLRVLDSRTVELAIQRAIFSRRHLVATVSCPREILQQKGLRFACRARTKQGVIVFTVTELDGDGHVRSVGE